MVSTQKVMDLNENKTVGRWGSSRWRSTFPAKTWVPIRPKQCRRPAVRQGLLSKSPKNIQLSPWSVVGNLLAIFQPWSCSFVSVVSPSVGWTSGQNWTIEVRNTFIHVASPRPQVRQPIFWYLFTIRSWYFWYKLSTLGYFFDSFLMFFWQHGDFTWCIVWLWISFLRCFLFLTLAQINPFCCLVA